MKPARTQWPGYPSNAERVSEFDVNEFLAEKAKEQAELAAQLCADDQQRRHRMAAFCGAAALRHQPPANESPRWPCDIGRGCSGPCDQGRQQCPSPAACGQHDDDDAGAVTATEILGPMAVAIAVVGAMLLAVHLILSWSVA